MNKPPGLRRPRAPLALALSLAAVTLAAVALGQVAAAQDDPADDPEEIDAQDDPAEDPEEIDAQAPDDPEGIVAQAPDDPEEIVVEVEGDPEDPRAPSAWRSTFNTERLRLSGAELDEALLALPGVYVRRAATPGGRATLSLRGASAQQVKVLLDGVPLDESGGVDLGLIPPALIDKVEVYRGASGARFGSGALGGAVQLSIGPPKRGARLSLSSGLASAGTLRAGAALAAGAGALRGALAVEALSSQGDFRFEDDQGHTRARVGADVQRVGAVAALHLHPDPDTRLSLTEVLVLADRGQPGPAEFQALLDAARLEDQRSTLALAARRSNLVDLDAAAVDGQAHLAWRAARARYFNPDRLLLSAAPYDTRSQEDALEASITASAFGPRALIAHLTLEAALTTLQRAELIADGQRQRTSFDRGRLAAAAIVEWLPTEDGELSILPALRVEAVQGVATEPIPALGLRWAPAPSWTLMANVGRAWRAPSFDELFLKNEFIEGNPQLKPEDALGLDAGAAFEPAPWARLEAVAFALIIDDLILFLPVSSTLFRAQNTGRASSGGVESALSLSPAPWLRLTGSWTFTDARLQAPPQDPLPGRPAHKVAAEATLLRPGLEIFCRATARSTVFLDNFGNLSNPPAAFVDLGVMARPGGGWTVGAVAHNLLDERAALDALQAPLPGLSFSLQLSWASEPGSPLASEPRKAASAPPSSARPER